MDYSTGLIQLYVRDIARAQVFYTDVLGMRVLSQFSGPTFVFLQPPSGTPIALVDAATVAPGTNVQPGGFNLGFAVDDVRAAHADWKALGIESVSDITDMGAGEMFTAYGPDGHELNVHQLYSSMLAMRNEVRE